MSVVLLDRKTGAAVKELDIRGGLVTGLNVADQVLHTAQGELLVKWWKHGDKVPRYNKTGFDPSGTTWNLHLCKLNVPGATNENELVFDMRAELRRALTHGLRISPASRHLQLDPPRVSPDAFQHLQAIGADLKDWFDHPAGTEIMRITAHVRALPDRTIEQDMRVVLNQFLRTFEDAIVLGWKPGFPVDQLPRAKGLRRVK